MKITLVHGFIVFTPENKFDYYRLGSFGRGVNPIPYELDVLRDSNGNAEIKALKLTKENLLKHLFV